MPPEIDFGIFEKPVTLLNVFSLPVIVILAMFPALSPFPFNLYRFIGVFQFLTSY